MIDILAIAAHPDDVELAASGTLLMQKMLGKRIGIVDLTRGELGTRGTAEIRLKEADESAKILGLDARENLNLGDGFFEETEANILKIIGVIRKYKPSIVLANAIIDRHPDHARASKLVERAAFLAGLPKIVDEQKQAAHRPKAVFNYIQDRWIEPDFVVDITAAYKTKLEAIMAFKTQFYDPNNKEPKTPISGADFVAFLEGRAREFGRYAGVEFGEGFTKSKALTVHDLHRII